MDIPVGKILNEDGDLYHQREAVSFSRLKVFAKSPLLYYQLFVDKSLPRPTSNAFEVGKAFHYRCEGARAFRKHVAVNTKFPDFKTKEAREWRDAHNAAGRVVLSPEDNETVSRMVHGFARNPLVKHLLKGTEREVTWRFKIGNYLIQCRTDRWCEKPRVVPGLGEIGPYFVDFKSVPSLSDEDFSLAMSKFDYHWQESFYRQVIMQVLGDQLRPIQCFFVVTEKAAPWSTQVFTVHPEAQALAHASIMQQLAALRRCYETNVWFTPQIVPIVTPLKFWRQREEELELGLQPSFKQLK